MLSIRNHLPLLFLVLTCGCPSTPPPEESENSRANANDVITNGPLQVIVLDDPQFSKSLEREWVAQSEYEIAISNETETSFLQQLRDDRDSVQADVVIFPSRLLGELAENRFLRSLPSSLTDTNTEKAVEGYNLADVYRSVARREMTWEGRQLAVSLGAPVPLLVVRRDFVKDVPKTWSELESFVKTRGSKLPSGMRALAEPLADGWAAKMFLSRASSYLYEASRVSSFFDYSNMKPRITLEPCERALREMVALYDDRNRDLNPSGVFKEFLDGRTALALTWPCRLESAPIPGFPVTIHELPGTHQEYDSSEKKWQDIPNSQGTPTEKTIRRVPVLGHEGRLGAIFRKGKNPKLAGFFLGWAGSTEPSSHICSRSLWSAPMRRTHSTKAQNWCGEQLQPATALTYAECLESTLNRSEVFVSLRLPAQDRYMSRLNELVLRALEGELAPHAALDQASHAWERITDQLGREEQIAAYRHSLGINID